MPYLYETLTGDKIESDFCLRRLAPIPLNVERIEVWASSFSDPGPDYNEYRMFDERGELIRTARVDGY